jgi:hypothetical protein
LAVLVYAGDLVLAIPGKNSTPPVCPQLAGTGVDELTQFKHIERPKDWNLPALKALFELLGLTPGMAQLVTQGKEEPVQQLQKAITESPWKAGAPAAELQTGLFFWGRSLLAEEEVKSFAPGWMRPRPSWNPCRPTPRPAKLKNFRYDASEVTAHRDGLNFPGRDQIAPGTGGDLGSTLRTFPPPRRCCPPNTSGSTR